MAAIESEARRLLALTKEGTLGQRTLEGLLAFAIGGVVEAFQWCFVDRGWSRMDLPVMLEEWQHPGQNGESQV